MSRWLVAVDIGNSVVKGGVFDATSGSPNDLADEPLRWADAPLETPLDLLSRLGVEAETSLSWCVSSVQRAAEERLRSGLAERRPLDAYRRLAHSDVPLGIDVDFPERVGMDRLATAVAANSLRPAEVAAIVVDAGTAIKVHGVTATGVFVGGAILPGFRLAAESLRKGTDLLPLVAASLNIDPPDVLGRNTEAAIRSGLYWGAVGAVRELVERMRERLGGESAVFVTGGDARGLGLRLDHGLRFVPHLCLLGIAHMARHPALGERSDETG